MLEGRQVEEYFKGNAGLSHDRSAPCSQKRHVAWFQLHEVKISGSRTVPRGSQGIRDQFPRDPWTHFCNG